MEMQKTITSLLILVLLLFGVVSALALEAPLLEADDCQMCHADVIAVVQEFGGKHRDAVTCIECHREHPPRGANAIPACSLCHDPAENEHFKAGGCLGCHNPHRPKQIDFSHAARVAPACSGCHPKQGGELLAYPSNHSVLDCKDCHLEHGQFLNCLECHAAHLAGQTYADCRQCHRPHSPLKVVYLNNLGSEQCSACHPSPAERLAQTTTKHGLLRCVYCHKSQHKRVPACETCHFKPHDLGMHEKFPKCVSCHGGPHLLIN
ncbi:cytochrome c3 family protein [Malonomonas rubra]|uniref:cytochrome c3 family protein n=1 Tax=Malonomonas rubra TaxID=57040 RepID=UPI0026EC2806|nr:cytochrome c3 family protein [Malonomonas rubra]